MGSLTTLLGKINEYIVNPLLALLFAVALGYFFWGLMQFVLNAESDEGRQVGRRHLLWGTIGIFCMTSVFLLLRLVLASFGIDVSDPNIIPPDLPL